MNTLIQQLQVTPKWKGFEEWYNKFVPTYSLGNKAWLKDIDSTTREGEVDFLGLPIEFQKGVFEKFFESEGYHLCTERRKNSSGLIVIPVLYKIPLPVEEWSMCLVNDTCNSFEELLIWYFNN